MTAAGSGDPQAIDTDSELAKSFARIADLMELEDGWDSYGGDRIRPDARTQAEQLVTFFAGLGIRQPHVFPMCDGNLCLEWWAPGMARGDEFHIETQADGRAYVSIFRDGSYLGGVVQDDD